MSNIFTIYYNLQNIIITLKKLDVLFDKIENLNSYCNNKEELKNTLVISPFGSRWRHCGTPRAAATLTTAAAA